MGEDAPGAGTRFNVVSGHETAIHELEARVPTYASKLCELEWVRGVAEATHRALSEENGVVVGILDQRAPERPEVRSFVAVGSRHGRVDITSLLSLLDENGQTTDLPGMLATGALWSMSAALGKQPVRRLLELLGHAPENDLFGVLGMNDEGLGCLVMTPRIVPATFARQERAKWKQISICVREKLRAAGRGLRELECAGRRWKLTDREKDVLALVARGVANKEVALKLGCAVSTAELHVTRILRKSGAESRAQVVARFWTGE